MLYLHNLNHLTPKAADLESVYLIREIKQKTPYPFTEEKLKNFFGHLLVSDTDKESIIQAMQLLEPTTEKVKKLLLERNPAHEPANLQRTIQILEEMPGPLYNNFQYLQDLMNWQKSMLGEINAVLNQIPKLRTTEEKMTGNQLLKRIFQNLLRNKEFGFNALDIVNEMHTGHIQGLQESLRKGYLFHFTLEEELKKLDFEWVKGRIQKEHLEENEALLKNVTLIKKGIDAAYDMNMRMVNLAVILYSYVKWLNSGNL